MTPSGRRDPAPLRAWPEAPDRPSGLRAWSGRALVAATTLAATAALGAAHDDRPDHPIAPDLGDGALDRLDARLPHADAQHDRVGLTSDGDRGGVLGRRSERDHDAGAPLDLRLYLTHLVVGEAQAQVPQVED